jgi:hypothetical protein
MRAERDGSLTKKMDLQSRRGVRAYYRQFVTKTSSDPYATFELHRKDEK